MEKALYEIAHALNRLTILKALEIQAASIREADGKTPDEAEVVTSLQKAEWFLRETTRDVTSDGLCSVINDAEKAIFRIAEESGIKSPAVQWNRDHEK